ncbi:MAG: hypothetical protein ACK5UE_08715 [Chitinophagales bacterium]|jgi:hypothetical protein
MIANKFFDLLNDSKYLCAVHEDDHIHWHVLGSGVTNQGLANRLTRADFLRIKEEMQEYCVQNYYEYTKNSIIDFKSPSKRLDNDIDMQMNKRGTKSEKQILKEKVELIYKNCTNKDMLVKRLTDEGIETYSRGKNIGIVSENGRHWRLSNFLGKDWEMELSKVDDNLKSLENIRKGENVRDRIVNLETKNKTELVSKELDIENLFREGESMEDLFELDDSNEEELNVNSNNLSHEDIDLEL